jgi:light-regulated signal transduction histidine kinase (bacteriophytochrome)
MGGGQRDAGWRGAHAHLLLRGFTLWLPHARLAAGGARIVLKNLIGKEGRLLHDFVRATGTRPLPKRRYRASVYGAGILEEAATRVFEKFYRVDKARSRAEGRSGHGLPIVKWIAEAHHSSVGLESALEHGSSFTVSFFAR